MSLTTPTTRNQTLDQLTANTHASAALPPRSGNDLSVEVPVPLVAALTGGSVSVPTIDGRRIDLQLGDRVVAPGSTRVIRGEGMPISKQPGQRGDLVVKLKPQFPASLTPEQKQRVRSALAGL